MKISRVVMISLATLIFPISPAFGADNEATKSEDTSKNPLTGTVTETQKQESKSTNAEGSVTKKKKKKVKKKKADGSTEQKTESESSTDKK